MKRERVQKTESCCPSVKPSQKQSIFAPRPFAPKVEKRDAPAQSEQRLSFSLADISILPRKTVQPKLVLGPAGDKYEQEADRVARQVVDTISSSDQSAVQREEDLEDEEELDLEEALEEEDELIQGKFASVYTGTLQAKEEAPSNETGMPDRLKSGIENLSGMDISAVRVHYNSPKPTQLDALAYTQGQEIHIAPGREKHLPHEGWHAVQQMQGRVKPTGEVGGMPLNDNRTLEAEADSMGKKALQQYAPVEKPKKKESRVVGNSVDHEKSEAQQGFSFTDNRPESVAQKKLQSIMNNYPISQVIQRKGSRKSTQLQAQAPPWRFSRMKHVVKEGYHLVSDFARSTAGPVVQRASVTGEFLDPTPNEGSTLEASGNPLHPSEFCIKASFGLVPPNTVYTPGEYRQYVKGVFRKNGAVQKHKLAGGKMSETEWMEDIIGRDKYGYRNRGASRAPYGFFDDVGCTIINKENGRFFRSYDTPRALVDDTEMDLHFLGKLVDVHNNNAMLAERHWHVKGER